MTRRGKIARLPQAIREELNRRLADGEPGGALLPWLNGLPAARTVLASQFGGAAITKQNLSEWRRGGFVEWRARLDLLTDARQFPDGAQELRDAAQGKLTDDLATVLAAQYAVALGRWNGRVDEVLEARLRVLHGLCREIVALRRGDHHVARLELERERLEFERERLEFAREKAGVKALAQLSETKQQAESPEGLARDDHSAEGSTHWMEEIFGLASDPGVAGAAEAEESKLVAPGRGEKNLREPGGDYEVGCATMDIGGDRQESEMLASAPKIFHEGGDWVRSGVDWRRFEADKGGLGQIGCGLGQLRGKSDRVEPGPSENFFPSARGDEEERNVNGVFTSSAPQVPSRAFLPRGGRAGKTACNGFALVVGSGCDLALKPGRFAAPCASILT